MTNNHNNKYDPNTIYTSTQYLIDTDPYLLKDEKKVMQLNKNLCNPKSHDSTVFSWSVKQNLSNALCKRKFLFINEFRTIVDPLIKSNIGELPENAIEVQNFNKTLTKFALNALLDKMIGNNTNIKEHNLLLLDNKNDDINSIFGTEYNNNTNELNNIKYKNKKCFFKITSKYSTMYYTVILQ